MAKISAVALTDTFSEWLDEANIAYARLNQFAINESTLYANTISANVAFVLSGTTITASGAEINYTDGVTSAIQTQMDTKQTVAIERAALANTNAYIASMSTDVQLANTNAYIGAVVTSLNQRLGETATVALTGDITASATAFSGNTVSIATAIGSAVIVNADVSGSAALEFSKMENLTASRALVSDGSGDVSASAVTSTEVGYLDGVSSAIQTQMDTKQTVAIERAALANTNAYIASTSAAGILANTNAYIGAVVTSLNQRLGETATITLTGDVTASATAFSSNTVSIATTDTNLGNTNSYIAGVSTTASAALPKAGGTMTGDLVLSGADVQLNLGANTAIKQGSANTIVLQTGKAAGLTTAMTIDAVQDITVASDIKFPDGGKGMWGAGSDLQIYHSGSHSFVHDTGTGSLHIAGSATYYDADLHTFRSADAGETMATFTDNGAAVLYYDNSAKITTTSAGSTLAGTTSGTFSGNITGNVTGNASGSSGSCTGNAATATALATGRTIAMTGDVTWTSASFTGSGNVTGTAAIGSNVIIDADVNSAAAIAWSKMANLTASKALYSDGSGDVTASSVTSTELGYVSGVSSAIQTQLGTKAPLSAPALTGSGTFYAMAGRVYTATTNGSLTLDFSNYTNFAITLNGNLTLANPSTEVAGMTGMICLIQDGTGSRTLSLGTDYETTGGTGITLSTAASKTDLISYFVHSSGRILLGDVNKAFS